jgi:hypothetical protein
LRAERSMQFPKNSVDAARRVWTVTYHFLRSHSRRGSWARRCARGQPTGR